MALEPAADAGIRISGPVRQSFFLTLVARGFLSNNGVENPRTIMGDLRIGTGNGNPEM